MLRRRALAIAAAVASPVLLLAACSHARSAGSHVTMSFCGVRPQQKPTVIEVVCQTDDITARALKWSSWGSPVTTATGRAVVDLCAVEDCHSGSYQSFPIVLILSRPVRCANNHREYSRLQYTFVGHSPFESVPKHVNFQGFIVGQSRPQLPRNQLVSLSC